MDMDTAMQISRKIADTRKEKFVVIGHRGQDEEPVATSLGRALPLDGIASGHQATWVVVEAAASVKAGGAKEHARAEQDVGVEVSEKMTVVCFYTEDALKQVTSGKVYDLHSVVAAPGQV